MPELSLSGHALARKTQRGFKASDFEQIISYGTPVGDMEIMLTEKDAEEAIRIKKQEIEAIERSTNCIVVLDGHQLITAYPLNRKKQRARMRHARKSGW